MTALEVDDVHHVVTFPQSNGLELTWGSEELADSVRAEIEDPNGVPTELREWRGVWAGPRLTARPTGRSAMHRPGSRKCRTYSRPHRDP